MCTFSNFVTLLTLPQTDAQPQLHLEPSLGCLRCLSTNLLVNNRRRQPGGLRNNYEAAAAVAGVGLGLGLGSRRVTNDLI